VLIQIHFFRQPNHHKFVNCFSQKYQVLNLILNLIFKKQKNNFKKSLHMANYYSIFFCRCKTETNISMCSIKWKSLIKNQSVCMVNSKTYHIATAQSIFYSCNFAVLHIFLLVGFSSNCFFNQYCFLC
jgi:hypothetical protein